MEKFMALSEEKQTTIRNAALSCFAKHGYTKTSINDIATAAGISKASMFQYFGNKRTLYEYLFNYCSAQMKQVYDLYALEANTDLGLLKPTGGSVSIFGLDCNQKSSDIAKDVGYLPSENCYYNKLKVREQLQYTADLYGIDGRERMAELASRLNLCSQNL